MSEQPEDFLEFGVYRIDPGQRVLLSRGTPIPLSPKIFDTLLALAQEPGRVLEKGYLLQRIWPDTFVEEGSLARNVSLLRRVLGQSPDGHEYIETIPKRGYRFRGSVRRVSGGQPIPAALDGPPGTASLEDARELRAAGGNATSGSATRLGVILASGVGLVLVTAVVLTVWRLVAADERRVIDSLAVLPFLNLSAGGDGEYISDGLTEELINALANIPGLHVVSRTTVFQFKNRASDVRELGRRLKVDAVIEGSVRWDGDRIRVTVQLNSAADGYHLWSRTWDGNAGDVFAVQQSIAQQVALSLRPSDAGVVVAGRPPTVDREGYNLYLQGQFHRRRATTESLHKAVRFYRQAIERDSQFAEAYVGLAIVLNEAGADGRLSPSDAYPESKAAVVKALELNPLLGSAYAAQGWILTHYDWTWDAAEWNLRRAISIGPADAETHHAYSHFLLAVGRMDESLAQSRRAIALDPLNAGMRGHLVLHFVYAREFALALDAADAALEIDPAVVDGWRFGRLAREVRGEFDEAIHARAQLGQKPELIAALRAGLAEAGAQGYWRALRDSELDMPPDARGYDLAVAYAQLGQRHEAIDRLEHAFRERQGWLVYLNANAHFDGLRGDPRFENLVARIGLPVSR